MGSNGMDYAIEASGVGKKVKVKGGFRLFYWLGSIHTAKYLDPMVIREGHSGGIFLFSLGFYLIWSCGIGRSPADQPALAWPFE